ncbi:MAG: hypothetical protein E7425_09130 [Ruminococcaceae bacterium]|nr:hypothetical protein [Oscillospiraceae bacterium]
MSGKDRLPDASPFGGALGYGFYRSEGKLWLGDTPAANFDILSVTPLYPPDPGGQAAAYQIEVSAAGQRQCIVAKADKPLLKQLCQQAHTCRVFGAKAEQLLDALVIEMALKSSESGVFLESYGLFQLDGIYRFQCGGETLGTAMSRPVVLLPELTTLQLVTSEALSVSESTEVVLRASMEHITTVWPTFCYGLLSSMRSRLVAEDIGIFPTLFVTGTQGYGKTTVVRHFLLTCDRRSPHGIFGMLDRDSTLQGVRQQVCRYRDQALLLDNIDRTERGELDKTQLKLVEECIHMVSNENQRASAGTGHKLSICRSGLAITATGIPSVDSVLTRLILVQLDKPLKDGKPSDRVAAATALRGWLLWLLPSLDEAVTSLKERLQNLPNDLETRLATTEALMNWSAELFLKFSIDCMALSPDVHARFVERSRSAFHSLLEHQQALVKKLHASTQHNLAWYVRKIYQSGTLDFAAKKKKVSSKEQCYSDDEIFYITPENLANLLRQYDSAPHVSKRKLGARLKDVLILDEGETEHFAQTRLGKKRIRFLTIDLRKLEKKAR